jgi:hypothetical protein
MNILSSKKTSVVVLTAVLLLASVTILTGAATAQSSAADRAVPSEAEPGDQISVTIGNLSDGDSLIDVYDPSFEQGTITNAGDADFDFVSASTGEVSFNSISQSEVSYTVTLSSNLTAGDTVTVSSDASSGLDLGTDTIDVVSGSTPEPANFSVSNLTAPTQPVTTGDSVSISADIENTGAQSGTQEITLELNGSTEATTEETLAAGASRTVSFNITAPEAGTYDYVITSANESSETGTLQVDALDPANFTVSNLNPQTDTVDIGEEFTVSATVENTGEQTATQDIELSIGSDGPTETQSLKLSPNESQTVEFTSSVSTADQYNHTIASGDDQVEGTLTVENPYLNDNGNVDNAGARDAIDDYRADKIDRELLLQVLDIWRSSP